MIVIPAIDLRGGRAVRLLRGDPKAETSYSEDPVAVAERFQAEGARRLHVVDLDAALDEGDNREVITAICHAVVIPVQVGGGLRSLEAIGAGPGGRREPGDPGHGGRGRIRRSWNAASRSTPSTSSWASTCAAAT